MTENFPGAGWYDELMAGDVNGENPFADSRYLERRSNAAMHAYLRAGGRLADWMAIQDQDRPAILDPNEMLSVPGGLL